MYNITAVELNSNICHVLYSVLNDQAHDTRLDLSISINENLDNLFAFYSVYMQDSEYDKDISKLFFSSNISFKKLFSGVRGNFILSHFFDIMQKSADFNFELPFKKVR